MSISQEDEKKIYTKHLKHDKPLTAFTSRKNHLTYLLNRFHGAKHMYVLNIFGEFHGRNTVLQELKIQNDTPEKNMGFRTESWLCYLLGAYSLASNLNCSKSKVGNSNT